MTLPQESAIGQKAFVESENHRSPNIYWWGKYEKLIGPTKSCKYQRY